MSKAKVDVGVLRTIMQSLDVSADVANLAADVPLSKQGVDSLDFVNFMFTLEKNYDIKISDAEVSSAQTLEGIVVLVTAKLASKS